MLRAAGVSVEELCAARGRDLSPDHEGRSYLWITSRGGLRRLQPITVVGASNDFVARVLRDYVEVHRLHLSELPLFSGRRPWIPISRRMVHVIEYTHRKRVEASRQ